MCSELGKRSTDRCWKGWIGYWHEKNQFVEKDCLAHGFKVIWLFVQLLCVVRKIEPPFLATGFFFIWGGRNCIWQSKLQYLTSIFHGYLLPRAHVVRERWVDGK